MSAPDSTAQDRFAGVLGSERGTAGSAAIWIDPSRAGQAQRAARRLTDETMRGELDGALRVLRQQREHVDASPLLTGMRDQVREWLSEDLFASMRPHSRQVLDLAGLRQTVCETVVTCNTTGHLHLWPDGRDVPVLAYAPSTVTLACGPRKRTGLFYPVRGAWAQEPDRRCPQCADLADDALHLGELTETEHYPLFPDVEDKRQLRAALAEHARGLLDTLLDTAGAVEPGEPAAQSQAMYLSWLADYCARQAHRRAGTVLTRRLPAATHAGFSTAAREAGHDGSLATLLSETDWHERVFTAELVGRLAESDTRTNIFSAQLAAVVNAVVQKLSAAR